MLKKWLGFSIILSACVHQPSEPLQIGALNALPDIAVEYETTVIEPDKQEHRYRWYFWRTANRVETQNLYDNTGEVWTKSATGDVEYERVFHNEKQIIDYRSSDLKAIGYEPNWAAISTLHPTPATRLVAVNSLPHPSTADYHHIDFADIGDKESDSFIQSILPKLKGNHH
jgi:hypothetical protein